MQYTRLGRTGLPVSRLRLGTMSFGPQTEALCQELGAGTAAYAW